MKKFKGLLVLLILFVITGCSLGNSPKSKVEALLMKYQTNSSDLKTELDDFLDSINAADDYKDEYRKVYERQYKDLKYKIKDEKIDGDKATVTAEIEVYDYYKDYKGKGINSDEDIRLDNYIEEYVVDAVIRYFGCYNTSILVSMTHLEKPWIFSRKGLSDDQASNKIIEKDLINSYFKEVKDKYNIINFVDIKDYSKDLFFKVIN